MTTPDQPSLQVTDNALAKIAAHVAITTPGVARLHPGRTRVLTRTAAGAARSRLPGGATARPAADPAAITIDQAPPGGGPAQVTVRIIATGDPPVLQTAAALQHRIHDALQQLTGLGTDVRIHVAALDG